MEVCIIDCAEYRTHYKFEAPACAKPLRRRQAKSGRSIPAGINSKQSQMTEFQICFACLREAASAKAGISIFGFRIFSNSGSSYSHWEGA
jgi:hypothetical protein